MGATYTEAQKDATKRYLQNFTECKIRVTPDEKERYKRAAKSVNLSLNNFFIRAVNEKIERERL